jgi:uncharacterized paraquat-inducible protein A
MPIEVQAQTEDQKEEQRPDRQQPERATSRLELKYCEGCGALTLRPSTSSEIYCPRCAKKFAEIARGEKAGRRL